MDDRVVIYEREGEGETEKGKQRGRTIRKKKASPGAFQKSVGMRQGSQSWFLVVPTEKAKS